MIMMPGEPQGRQGGERKYETLGRMLARDLAELLRHTPEEEYHWADTQVALVEACHIAWATGLLCDRKGHKVGFRRLVERVCRTLHVSVPRNPSAVVGQARRRKGVRLGQLAARYELLRRQGVGDPFRLDVRRGSRHRRQK